jgi:hypothetical protein
MTILYYTGERMVPEQADVRTFWEHPNYNHAQFLPSRLDSILSQTLADFELIYLDDASTDNSDRGIASFLEERRIREKAIGLGRAFVRTREFSELCWLRALVGRTRTKERLLPGVHDGSEMPRSPTPTAVALSH